MEHRHEATFAYVNTVAREGTRQDVALASRYRSGKSIVLRQWLMASLVLTRSGYRLGRRALRLSHLGDERRAAIYDFYLV